MVTPPPLRRLFFFATIPPDSFPSKIAAKWTCGQPVDGPQPSEFGFLPVCTVPAMTRTLYGNKKDGTAVHAYNLGGAPGLGATVLDMGGTITAIEVPTPDGGRRNVVLTLSDITAFETSGWWNCLIGRFANRLRNGFTLDGRHHDLPKDANGVTLHGTRPLSSGTRL